MFRKIAFLMSAATIAATPLAAQTVSGDDPAFIAKLRATVLAHPDILVNALQKFQADQQKNQTADLSKKAEFVRPLLKQNPPIGPVLGNKNAKVTIGEFLDYACPFCKRAHDTVDQIVKKRSDVRFIIIQRPILGPESETLARFALAADMQGKFAQANDALYDKFGDDHQTHATEDNMKEVAEKAGVDYARAVKDMQSPQVQKILDAHKAISEKVGVNGTPFFVTPDNAYPGAVPDAVLEQSIDKAAK